MAKNQKKSLQKNSDMVLLWWVNFIKFGKITKYLIYILYRVNNILILYKGGHNGSTGEIFSVNNQGKTQYG